jgi:proliferating cell nuclear antigen PCNA
MKKKLLKKINSKFKNKIEYIININIFKLNMSSVTLKDNTFVKVIDILKDLLDECCLKFTKKGIEINTICKYKISFIMINLVDIYKKCNLKKNITITVNLSELQKILKCQEKDENLIINLKNNVMELIFENEVANSLSKYKLKLLENDDDECPEIEIEENTKLELSAKYFTSLCKKINNFDECLKIECKKKDETILFKSGSEDIVEIQLGLGADKLSNMCVKENMKTVLTLKMLMSFAKAEKFTDKLLIIMEEDDMPVKLEYNFGESYIIFFLSPQEQDD